MSDTKTCKTCGSPLIIKQTHRSPAQLKKPYYYTAYYFCSRCQKMYLSDEFKVINDNFDLFTRKEFTDSPIDAEIWTDGAARNNGRENAKAAWGFVAHSAGSGQGGGYEASGLVTGKQTNNRAEAEAILEALKWAAGKGLRTVRIHSDSQITLHNMRKRLDQIKVNQDIYEKLFDTIERNNLEVDYVKVLGHSGDVNNERADKLANELAGIK